MGKKFGMWILLAFVLAGLFSCAPAQTDSKGDNDDDGLTASWRLALSFEESPDGEFFPPLRVMGLLNETDTTFEIMYSTSNPRLTSLVSIARESGRITETHLDSHYVTAAMLDSFGEIVCLNQLSFTEAPAGAIVRIATGGESTELSRIDSALLYRTLAMDEDGIWFGYREQDGVPVLVRSDLDGNVLWEKRSADELDPVLGNGEHIVPGRIVDIVSDVDGSAVVLQNVVKEGVIDGNIRNAGYVVYKVETNGTISWTQPYYRARTAWGEEAEGLQIGLFDDGTILVEDRITESVSGSASYLHYLDNKGRYIRPVTLESGFSGSGRFLIDTDGHIVFIRKEYWNGYHQTVLYKLDTESTSIWTHVLFRNDVSSDAVPLPLMLDQRADGGFLWAGTVYDDVQSIYSLVFVRCDAEGNLEHNPLP